MRIRGYLERGAPPFAGEDVAPLRPCGACGQPTTGAHCAFCRARAHVLLRLGERPSDREIADALSDEVLPDEISLERTA